MRILENAAARCNLSAAEFRNCESVVLFTDRQKRCENVRFVVNNVIYMICYAFVASAVILLCVCTALLRKGGTVS